MQEGMWVWRDARNEGCRKGVMWERMMQERSKQERRMQERRDTGDDRCKK